MDLVPWPRQQPSFLQARGSLTRVPLKLWVIDLQAAWDAALRSCVSPRMEACRASPELPCPRAWLATLSCSSLNCTRRSLSLWHLVSASRLLGRQHPDITGSLRRSASQGYALILEICIEIIVLRKFMWAAGLSSLEQLACRSVSRRARKSGVLMRRLQSPEISPPRARLLLSSG